MEKQPYEKVPNYINFMESSHLENRLRLLKFTVGSPHRVPIN
jgi:hypothetical protein